MKETEIRKLLSEYFDREGWPGTLNKRNIKSRTTITESHSKSYKVIIDVNIYDRVPPMTQTDYYTIDSECNIRKTKTDHRIHIPSSGSPESINKGKQKKVAPIAPKPKVKPKKEVKKTIRKIRIEE